MSPPTTDRPTPPNSLSLLLATLATAGFLLFLILVSGGFFLWVVLTCIVLLLVGRLHYSLWGHAMQQETRGEREEATLRDEAEQEPW